MSVDHRDGCICGVTHVYTVISEEDNTLISVITITIHFVCVYFHTLLMRIIVCYERFKKKPDGDMLEGHTRYVLKGSLTFDDFSDNQETYYQ